jgi:hypothetical protein
VSFASEIREALRLPNRDASVDTVHRIVINGLKELDPRVKPRQTGYFNHSWAPDMVVGWDAEPFDRELFLRFDVANDDFAREVTLIGSDAPIFLGLAPEVMPEPDTPRTREVAQEITDAAREYNTLVTDVTAVEVFANEVTARRDAHAATRAIVRGGQGVVDDDAATEIVSAYERAMGEIENGRRKVEVRSALDNIEIYLTERNALVFERELRSRWIGAGGVPEEFPGLEAWTLAARTPQEIADLVEALFEQEEDVPEAQWREVVSSVTANSLGLAFKGRKAVRGGRVNDLVRLGQEIWHAEWAYAPELPATSFLDDVNEWMLGSNYGLGLALSNCEVFFSDDGRRFSQSRSNAQLPELSQRRAVLDDTAVSGIGLVTPQEDVAISLRETATHTIGALIEELVSQESQTWRSALIARMTVEVVEADAIVEIDLRTRKIRATRPISLRVAALEIARYVAALSDYEMQSLERSLRGHT